MRIDPRSWSSGFTHDIHRIVFWLSLLPLVVFFDYITQRYVVVLRTRPNIPKEDIVYQKRFASGASQKNVLTKLGGKGRAFREWNSESWMRENRPSGLIRVGEQTVIGPRAFQPVDSRLLYTDFAPTLTPTSPGGKERAK
jgi:hypothetical protein